MRLTRRAWIAGIAASLRAAQPPFRLAICNDGFRGVPWGRQFRTIREAGFAGVELAPVTLGDDPAAASDAQCREVRQALNGEGLAYVGLHNLLTAPAGLHATTADAAVRQKTWQFLRRLVDLSAQLGDGGVLVFGSGKQRGTAGGATVAEAKKHLSDGFAALALYAKDHGVSILLEPLAPQFTNVVNTLAEAVAVVDAIAHPAVATMLDTHNTAAETQPAPALVRRYFKSIRHVHLNEMDGRRPGAGDYDFPALLKALRELNYNGWVSAEVFDFSPGADAVSRATGEYLRRVL